MQSHVVYGFAALSGLPAFLVIIALVLNEIALSASGCISFEWGFSFMHEIKVTLPVRAALSSSPIRVTNGDHQTRSHALSQREFKSDFKVIH